MNLSRILTSGFWKKFALWSVVGLVVFTLFGFFGLPYVLKYVLTSRLTKLFHRETTVQEVRFNPFYLTLQVKGFALKDRNGTDPFVSFEELALDLVAASIWERGATVKVVRASICGSHAARPNWEIRRLEDWQITKCIESGNLRICQSPNSG